MSGIEITAADNEAAASYLAATAFGTSKAQYLAAWQARDEAANGYVHPLAYLFAQTRTQVRNAALEDAARVAEDYLTQVREVLEQPDMSKKAMLMIVPTMQAFSAVADAIRTLFTQDTPDMRDS